MAVRVATVILRKGIKKKRKRLIEPQSVGHGRATWLLATLAPPRARDTVADRWIAHETAVGGVSAPGRAGPRGKEGVFEGLCWLDPLIGIEG